MSNIIKTETVN